ncbi:hypothetical protein DCO58_05685 [Helicobacter saguini]|nr:hypothetical protein [Helicobacter saguini]MWV62161.1 hypothetical protein [Helicobacter saguini]MWV67166.1 hypothetical protein [Helicobacter saguini]MWV70931.1 hypothetical protein [Helicobacter saguini]TLD92531.1 hypothetical protein LS64_010090 [Helicobacter saguini]
MLSYKKFVILTVIMPPIFIALLCTLLYLYDPLQLFHKPYLRPVSFMADSRLQDKGVIDFYDFNSVILGSSIFVNMSPKEANALLSNLSINENGGGG